jgi:hypothetical protein
MVGMHVPLDILIRKMQEPKDVRVIVRSDGAVAAVCKSCDIHIKPTEKNNLLWYVCPRCRGASFTAIPNLPRDIALAERHGGVFEYEVFYLRDLPPGFEPPPPQPEEA